jgi:hypothetical protein
VEEGEEVVGLKDILALKRIWAKEKIYILVGTLLD